MDIPYMRRRLKKGEAPTGSTPATAGTSLKLGSSLSLGDSSSTGDTGAISFIAKPRIPAIPGVEGKVILSLEEPSVRLSRVQSALGSMLISGAEAFAWEGTDGFGGLVLADGSESTAPMYSNRRLVEFHKGELVVGLRHFRNLRRLIVGTRQGILKARIYDESEVITDGGLGSNALLISKVGDQLEFRLEKINSVDLLGIFGVKVIP
jgi:hypothetical protein